MIGENYCSVVFAYSNIGVLNKSCPSKPTWCLFEKWINYLENCTQFRKQLCHTNCWGLASITAVFLIRKPNQQNSRTLY